MTDEVFNKTKALVRDWGPLFILIFTIGVAWATINSRVDQKLDSIRYVSDSLHVEATLDRQERSLQVQSEELKEAVNRLSQLLCYRNPNPACR